MIFLAALNATFVIVMTIFFTLTLIEGNWLCVLHFVAIYFNVLAVMHYLKLK